MKVSIIATGDELLMGIGKDTNSEYLSSRLSEFGIPLVNRQVVGDEVDELTEAIGHALKRSDCLIMTGGLGPTTDDLTREAMASALGRSLFLDQKISKRLKTYYQKRLGRDPEYIHKQALLIKGARAIPNRNGTAVGMLIDKGKKIVLLPGPPHEMIPMFDRYVLPKIRQWQGRIKSEYHTMRTFGVTESSVQEKMKSLKVPAGVLKIGYRASWKGVDIRIKAKKNIKENKKYLSEIRRLFKDTIYTEGKKELIHVVLDQLKESKKTVSVAESCTGGLLSEFITAVPGASSVYAGGIVVYSNALKETLLGVKSVDIKIYGAVSSVVCSAMARQVRKISNTDIGLASSGIAGPGGALRSKPVGTVYLALDTPEYEWCHRFQFRGDRRVVQHRATQTLLDILRRYLYGMDPP